MSNKLTPLQKQFVSALRSEKFTQGCGALEKDGCYCALGIACLVAEQNGISVVKWDDGRLRGPYLDHVQPDVFHAYRFHETGEELVLSLNDTDKKSFLEIADRIELFPEDFFVV